MTKQYSYQRHPVVMSVKIYTQDVTADLRALDDIQKSIDYPQLTEFRVGECSFTLKDIHGDFSPNNPANFFTRNGGKSDGLSIACPNSSWFYRERYTPHTDSFHGTDYPSRARCESWDCEIRLHRQLWGYAQ